MAGFGVKVKLNVDKSDAARKDFKSQIDSMIAEIKEVDIKAKLTIDSADIDAFAEKIKTNAEKKLKSNSIKIKSIKVQKIDCSSAIKTLREDIQSMINSLSIEIGVKITGLLDPTGKGAMSTDVKNIIDGINLSINDNEYFKTHLDICRSVCRINRIKIYCKFFVISGFKNI